MLEALVKAAMKKKHGYMTMDHRSEIRTVAVGKRMDEREPGCSININIQWIRRLSTSEMLKVGRLARDTILRAEFDVPNQGWRIKRQIDAA
ncbi:hypothetical protein GWI33_020289 [Rhynchophorus ferrugineus]|uniref:Uncharacterized protein n=1 Tax=Rhynchophorus ferrugineus TaxID=354439 RepID=A0A834HPR9_RHYFE|nr:hypothetical protein GWI33_020289 [Rhynchophorus ferrugineus]